MLPEKVFRNAEGQAFTAARATEQGGLIEGRSGQNLNRSRFGGWAILKVTDEDALVLSKRRTPDAEKEEILDQYFDEPTRRQRRDIPDSDNLLMVKDPEGVNIVRELPEDEGSFSINSLRASFAVKEFSPRGQKTLRDKIRRKLAL